MANKRANIGWTILIAACILSALATLVIGVVFAASAAKTGVVDRVAIILAAVSLGLSALSLGGLWLAWRRLRRG